MTTTTTPAKFKAYLGNLKETVLDTNEKSVNQSFQALLAAELAQRGVLFVDLNDGEKILDAVVSAAGKPLLDTTTTIPKPLVAASSAMAGMIAESCATLVAQGQSPSCFSVASLDTALTRCKDVTDERLLGLLQLLKAEEQETLLLYIAGGYFLRAASIQPDPPQMWKRSLDVIEKRCSSQQEPLEAAFPLEHLIQIAYNKGNEKRVSELSLRLAESWLSPRNEPTTALEKNLEQTFLTPFRPSTVYTETKCIENSKQALEKVNIALVQDDESNVFWFKLLRFRIYWSSEQAMIDETAQQLVAAAKNRGTTVSLESCKETAQSNVWTESLHETDFNTCAKQLCDLLLSNDNWKDDPTPRQASALQLLRQYSERLVHRARTISLASKAKSKPACTAKDACGTWNDVICFTKPIVQCIGKVAEWDLSASLEERQQCIHGLLDSLPLESRAFLQEALLATSCCAWMTSNNTANASSNFDLSFLDLLLDSLSIWLSMEEKSERQSQQDSIFKTSKEEGGSSAELTCAHATVLSLVGLAHVGDTSTSASNRATLMTHEASRKAIGMMEKAEKYQAQQAKYGSAYLLLLLSWSGLHCSPWPFCNVTQARAILRGARTTIQQAVSSWGRMQSTFEALLVDLCEADAEGGSLIGGFEKKAQGLYKGCLNQIEAGLDDVSGSVLSLLNAHCLNGLARLSLHGKHDMDTAGPDTAQQLGEQALAESNLARNIDSTSFYLWSSDQALGSSALFHVNVSRQLVADALVRASRPGDAQVFLEDAVHDSPSDFDAAFALGAFRLRMTLYETNDSSPEEQKIAQTQLLKSAKINSAKPDPFALLGIWYEVRNDLKRALGCYSKALLLDPSNPVAGRGVLRLKTPSEIQKLCVAATKSNSPVNGWAWHAIGQEKGMVENDDELAIVCFLQALRCRDVECPRNEALSIFFALPTASIRTRELSNVWADLAGSYRRVGRYAAAERAFQSAWQVDGNELGSQVFCAWAQVELELGLFEEAIDKFELVLEREKDSSHAIAAFGQGSALLALAHRDAVDGKAGAAFGHATRAIDCIEKTFLAEDAVSTQQAGCALKLLGDLYSFGALLPPDVFVDVVGGDESIHEHGERLLKAQASFIAKGGEAYEKAAETNIAFDDEDASALRSSLLCDLGGNILLQGQIRSSAFGEAQGGTPELSLKDAIENDPETKDAYNRAATVFKNIIATSPLHSPAWCGLGCALSATDPLLAQHAFCTSLTLDKMMPDSWSSLAFLFAGKGAVSPSAEMLDGLTQVADSPLMWICRALLLENEVQNGSGPGEAQFSQAADAYRAALQVVKHPTALLGLSLTCRAATAAVDNEKMSTYDRLSSNVSRRDSYGYMGEYLGLCSSCNVGAYVLGSTMTLEDDVESDGATRSDEVDKGCDRIRDGLEALTQLSSRAASCEEESRGIDMDSLKDLLENVPSKAPKSPRGENQAFSPARRIVHDPESGTAWLDMAKSLAKDLLVVSDNKKKKAVKEIVNSATRAGDRAAQILSDQLATPLALRSAPHVVSTGEKEEEAVVSMGVVPVPVDARDVSEALALSYWLELVEEEMLQEKGDGVKSTKGAVDLQRALVMDPSNDIARQALQSAISSS